MKEIIFSISGSTCNTPCPYKENIYVYSDACHKCSSFRDRVPGKSNTIYCTADGAVDQIKEEKKEILVETKSDYEVVWDFLSEKGLTLGEKLKVRSAFAKWAYQFDPDIERTKSGYKSKLISRYLFDNENEAKVLNAIHKLDPKIKHDDLIRVFSLLLKILEIDSSWTDKLEKIK